MTYLDYLNDFNQWLETNALQASSQLMYYKLLHVFNRAGWPEDVGVDNLRMMLLLDGASKTTVIRARDKLVEAGFLDFRKGRKGLPNRYALSLRYRNCTKNATENATEIATENATEIATKNATRNATHIKTKTKTKTKKIPPYPPEAEPNGFGPALDAAFREWLQYKQERREGYKPTGLRSLEAQLRRQAEAHGEEAVAALIRQCMAANWKGIIFDRLDKAKEAAAPAAEPNGQSWMRKYIQGREEADGC